MTFAGWIPGSGPFVGRQAELGLLKALWQETQSGAGRFVLIGGPAGIGKSRLVRELSAWARAESAILATGAAFEGEATEGFQPARDLLRSLERSAPKAVQPDVSLAIEALAVASASEEATQRQQRFDRVIDALDAVGRASGGCLLILEDAHWADESTWRLLTHVSRRVAGLPIMIVVTHRPAVSSQDDGLRALTTEVRRMQSGVRMSLAPFTAEEASRFVEAVAGDTLAGARAATLIQRSDGNPLFLEELVREALESPRRESSVPEAVADLVQDRLARLPGVTRRVAYAAAVLAENARLDRLISLTGSEEHDAATALDALAGAGILDPVDSTRVTFHHALIRDAVYAALPLAERTSLHSRSADLLEADTGIEAAAAAIASHLRAAGTQEALARAAQVYVIAARRSLDVLAYEDAAQQLATAVSLMQQVNAPAAQRLGAQLLLAEARRRAGDLDAALQAFHDSAVAARSAGDFEAEATAALGYERTFLATGRPRSEPGALSIPLLTVALEGQEPSTSNAVLRARLLAALAQARFFNNEAALGEQYAEDALSLARSTGDAAAETAALEARRIVSWRPDDPDKRLAIARDIVGLATSLGDREQLLDGLYWQISCSLEKGYVNTAARDIARYRSLGDQIHSSRRASESIRMAAMMAHLHGDTATALGLAAEALRLGDKAGFEEAPIHYAAQLVEFTDEGELDETPIRDLIRDPEPWQHSPSRRAMLAFLSWRIGRTDEAQRLIGDLAAEGFRDLARDWMWLPLIKLLCESITRMGQRDWAATVYELMLPYAGQFIVNSNTVFYGSVEHWLGVAAAAAGHDTAASHLKRAIRYNTAIEAPGWVARSQEALGSVLLSSGQRNAGTAATVSAVRGYEALGLQRSAERVAAALTPSTALAGSDAQPAGLTDREIEVLRLIATGRSNKEIADQLYLSIRTVERHITNIYAKIEAHGKADATAFAIRHHLVD